MRCTLWPRARRRTEFFLTGLVLINMAFLLVDMMITDDGCDVYGNVTNIQICIVQHSQEEFQLAWNDFFKYLELTFLSIFVGDIILRLYAYGIGYFADGLNAVDATIVILLFALQVRARAHAQTDTRRHATRKRAQGRPAGGDAACTRTRAGRRHLQWRASRATPPRVALLPTRTRLRLTCALSRRPRRCSSS